MSTVTTAEIQNGDVLDIPQVHSRWARLVSDVLSPPVVWALLAFPIAMYGAPPEDSGIGWALIYSVLVCIVPVLYIAWNVRRGTITDLHIAVRRQRIRPFIISIVCTALAYAVLVIFHAPRLMPAFALFSLIQIIVMTIITLTWQISMHAMSITGAVVAAGALYGVPVALVLSPLILIVSAARIRLRRHTFPQVVAGSLVGAAMTTLLFLCVRLDL